MDDLEACLQPISKGGIGTTLTVSTCGDEWLQQWKLRE
jgi:hypothetical protein